MVSCDFLYDQAGRVCEEFGNYHAESIIDDIGVGTVVPHRAVHITEVSVDSPDDLGNALDDGLPDQI
jgi:hypothetical protein